VLRRTGEDKEKKRENYAQLKIIIIIDVIRALIMIPQFCSSPYSLSVLRFFVFKGTIAPGVSTKASYG